MHDRLITVLIQGRAQNNFRLGRLVEKRSDKRKTSSTERSKRSAVNEIARNMRRIGSPVLANTKPGFKIGISLF